MGPTAYSHTKAIRIGLNYHGDKAYKPKETKEISMYRRIGGAHEGNKGRGPRAPRRGPLGPSSAGRPA